MLIRFTAEFVHGVKKHAFASVLMQNKYFEFDAFALFSDSCPES
jgi:hypothetical protein